MLGASRVAPPAEPVQLRRRGPLRELAEAAQARVVEEDEQAGLLVIERAFAAETMHGQWPVRLALEIPAEAAAFIAGDERLREMQAEQALFFDVETTSLGTAAGTLVFLLGGGFFRSGQFIVRQCFLADPAGEAAFLERALSLLSQGGYLVSYNGRHFDAPLLEGRFTLHRRRASISSLPHVDLLYAARKLYRRLLPDCCLPTVEREVLGVRRGGLDVPSFLVPQLYFEYLRTGEPGGMCRVLYHNVVDVLSLAALYGVIGQAVCFRRLSRAEEAAAAAEWFAATGRLTEAVAALRRALALERDPAGRSHLLLRLSLLLKRAGQWQEATQIWRYLVQSGLDAQGIAHVELAKFLEHRAHDYRAAIEVVQEALKSPAAQSIALREALSHRLERLQHKATRSCVSAERESLAALERRQRQGEKEG